MEINSLKLLTNSQQIKAEKITELLFELKKSGVYLIIVDGGGGNGIQFIRCSKDDLSTVGDLILEGNIKDVDDYIYSPKDYYKYTVDYLVP